MCVGMMTAVKSFLLEMLCEVRQYKNNSVAAGGGGKRFLDCSYTFWFQILILLL